MTNFSATKEAADAPAVRQKSARRAIVRAAIPAVRARLFVLGLLALGLLLPWGERRGPMATGFNGSDQSLHLATIARLGDGATYYDAVGGELRARNFPTASLFNWRTPLLYSSLSVNMKAARIIFIAVGLLVLACTVRTLGSESIPIILAGGIAQAGAIMVIFDPEVWVFHEVWAGFLIALSLVAYAANRANSGALLALIALFVRELVAPYALLCLVLAFVKRQWREVRLWAIGLPLYANYYLLHAGAVFNHQQGLESAHASGWVQFGGLRFITDTLRTNSLLHTEPVALASASVLVIAAGLLAPDIPARTRAAVAVYLAFFSVVGQSFNWYWGWLMGFVIPIVFAHGLVNVWRIARDAAPWRRRAAALRVGKDNRVPRIPDAMLSE